MRFSAVKWTLSSTSALAGAASQTAAHNGMAILWRRLADTSLLEYTSRNALAGRSPPGIGWRDSGHLSPAATSPRALSMAARLRSTSSSVVAQHDTLMRIATRPCQVVPPHQQAPSR